MGKKEILLENFEEYYNLAEQCLKNKKYNSAITLFFKAICALVDIFILENEGFVPSSHAHRFRVIQENYPELYKVVDKDFPFYQDSYTQKMNEEAAKLLKEDAQKIKGMLKK